jgi:acyl-CoA synthetase (NDP forming)
MGLRGQELVELLAHPAGVAIVGASSNPQSPSGRPVDYLTRFGFTGLILPVNPRSSQVGGLRTIPELGEAQPGTVEVALIAVPAPAVVPALADAARAGARAAVIIGSGFEDRGSPERRALDEFAAGAQLRIIGPNCVGTLGTEHAAYLTFSSVLRSECPQPGPVGLVTQSGALGNSLLQTLIRRHVGLCQWFSTGDEVDVGALELVTGLLSREEVTSVGLFLEGIGDIGWLPRLEQVLRDERKRLFVLKAASTSAGRQAAAGHTGRIVGSAEASRAILAEIGAVEVPTLSALADALVVAGTCGTVIAKLRPRVAIVSVSGAAGVIGSDRVAAHPHLAMAGIDEQSATLLRSRLDARLEPANPLDVPFLDNTAAFADAVSGFAATSAVDIVLGVESGLAHDRQELTAKLTSATGHAAIILTSLSEDDQIPSAAAEALAKSGIAYLPSIERAVDAVAACARPASSPAPPEPREAGVEGIEWAARRLPATFPWARWRVVASADEAAAAVADLGFPLVLKAAGRAITHRSEAGAVRIARERQDLAGAFVSLAAICAHHGDVVIAQELVPPGFELMMAAIRDEEFGPLVFVRPGGTYAETMTGQAVLWGGWPADRRERVLRGSSLGRLLDGYRGGRRYDIGAVSALASTLLAAVDQDMRFIEINPVIVGLDGVRVVDLIARGLSAGQPADGG